LHSRALACSPRSTAFYKGHSRSESLRQFGRPSPHIDGETGCLIQTDPLPIRRRCYGRQQVSASIQLRASSRNTLGTFPKSARPKSARPNSARPKRARSHRRHRRRHWPANSIKSAGNLYIALMRMAGHPSRIHMRRRAHWPYTMEDLGCFKSSHTFLPARLRRRVRLRSTPGGAQRRIKRTTIGPKRTICAAPVRNGGRNTLKSLQRATLGQFHE
jgi:hypothetical protein